MKKLILFITLGIGLATLVYAGNQYNWGNSNGGAWLTPDDTVTKANQVLQIGSSGGSTVVATSNPVIPSSMTVQGSLTLPNTSGQTIAQLTSLTPSATGQIVFCTNCTNTLLVISTGTATGSWAGVVNSTGSILQVPK